jgi:hypothetical protein
LMKLGHENFVIPEFIHASSRLKKLVPRVCVCV